MMSLIHTKELHCLNVYEVVESEFMIIYNSTKSGFMDDIVNGVLDEKVESLMVERFGRRSPESEMRAWRNSLTYMGNIIGSSYDPASDPDARINGKYPRLLTSGGTAPSSTWYLQNTSYVKLQSLQIGYTLPQKWLKSAHISNLRIFFTGENLLTITPYDGLDPELGGDESSNGIDRGYYPQARTFMVGLNLGF